MKTMKTSFKKGDLIKFISTYSNEETLYIYLGHYKDSFGMNYMSLMNVKKSCIQMHRLSGEWSGSPVVPGHWKKVN